MAKVELKQPVVEEISAHIKDAQSVVLVDYRGLTVEQDTQLRKQLREAGVTYKVYKNTMMNFAFKGTDFEALAPYLEGPSAVAISTTDATAPARILCKFAKEAPKLEVKGGVVEGIAYDANGIGEIAKIPSREELLSKLLGSIQSPITNFARVMNQLAEKGGASGIAAGQTLHHECVSVLAVREDVNRLFAERQPLFPHPGTIAFRAFLEGCPGTGKTADPAVSLFIKGVQCFCH